MPAIATKTNRCPCGISPIADCHRHGEVARLADRNTVRSGGLAAAREHIATRREPAKKVKLTVIEALILAAGTLGETFGRTALVLAAWRLDPARFGLEGCEDLHPDTNSVLSSLYGDRGLRRRGYVEQVHGGLWMLTREGRQELARLRGAQ